MELKGKKGDFDYAQSPKHLHENLRNPNGADRCLSGAEGSGYKHTEIGVIPEDWDLKKLNLIGEIVTGSTPSTYNIGYWNGNIPWITPTDITDSKDIFFGARSLTEQGFNQIRQLPKDTVLITCIASIGKNAILRINGGCNQQINAIIPNKHHSSEFVYYLIEGNKDYLRSLAGITATPIISKKDFTDFIFSFPPLPEQQKIAEALSDTDALIQSLKKLIAKKKDIKQGAMQELLSGKRRLEGFDGEWENVKLGEMLDYIQPTNFIVKSTEYSQTGNLPVLTAGKSFILGYTSEDFGVFEAIPVIIFDDFTTASKFVDFRFKVKSSAMKILKLKSDQFNIRFVFEIMKMIVYPLGDHKRHWIGEYQKIEVFVPGVKEQTAIAQILSDMDAEIEALEKQVQKTELLKQGMMQELLTGRIRLIKPEAEKLEMVAEPTQNYKTHRP